MHIKNGTRAGLLIGLAAWILLAGAVTHAASLPPGKILDLDPHQAHYCHPNGNVTGAYNWTNSTSPETTEAAKAQARARAAALGATHILWTRMTSSYSSAGSGRSEVAGQAYICRRPLPLP
jgi:hypothetical protein